MKDERFRFELKTAVVQEKEKEKSKLYFKSAVSSEHLLTIEFPNKDRREEFKRDLREIMEPVMARARTSAGIRSNIKSSTMLPVSSASVIGPPRVDSFKQSLGPSKSFLVEPVGSMREPSRSNLDEMRRPSMTEISQIPEDRKLTESRPPVKKKPIFEPNQIDEPVKTLGSSDFSPKEENQFKKPQVKENEGIRKVNQPTSISSQQQSSVPVQKEQITTSSKPPASEEKVEFALPSFAQLKKETTQSSYVVEVSDGIIFCIQLEKNSKETLMVSKLATACRREIPYNQLLGLVGAVVISEFFVYFFPASADFMAFLRSALLCVLGFLLVSFTKVRSGSQVKNVDPQKADFAMKACFLIPKQYNESNMMNYMMDAKKREKWDPVYHESSGSCNPSCTFPIYFSSK